MHVNLIAHNHAFNQEMMQPSVSRIQPRNDAPSVSRMRDLLARRVDNTLHAI